MLKLWMVAVTRLWTHSLDRHLTKLTNNNNVFVSVPFVNTTAPLQLSVVSLHDPFAHHLQSLAESTHNEHVLNDVHSAMRGGVGDGVGFAPTRVGLGVGSVVGLGVGVGVGASVTLAVVGAGVVDGAHVPTQ